MEKFRKIKTFEGYEKAGNPTALPPKPEPSQEEINNRIKEVIANILKTKHYIMLLQDTAEQVFKMLEKQIPPNKDAFVNTLYEKDQFLAELVEQVCDMLDNSSTLQELDEMVMTIKNLDQYTDDNMDDILSGKSGFEDDDDDNDDDEHMCPKCDGSGENEDGSECDVCDGTGFKTYEEEDEDEDDDEGEEVDIEEGNKNDDSAEQHDLEDQLKRRKK